MIRNILIYLSVIVVLGFLFSGKEVAGEIFVSSDSPEQNAIALFEDGRFQEALDIFEDLIRLYPEDKKLNYYIGVCLIETQNYGTRPRQSLLSSVDKDNPDKIDYYLGIAFHAENDFFTALDYYSRFKKNAKSKVRKSVDYERLMALCDQGVNPFVSAKVVMNKKLAEEVKEDSIRESVPEVLADPIADLPVVANEMDISDRSISIPSELKDSIIAFQVNAEIKYLKVCQFKSNEGTLSFVSAWLKQRELDSLVTRTDSLRAVYAISSAAERDSVGRLILDNEKQVVRLNREIKELNLLAHKMEIDYWNHSAGMEKEELLVLNQSILDSLAQVIAKRQKVINILPPKSVDLPIVEKEPTVEDNRQKGIIYKIQIGAFRKEPPEWIIRLYEKLSLFRKISNYTDENGVTVYTTGELRSYADAIVMQKQLKTEGVDNASIAAYNNGVRVRVSEARKINAE